MIQFRFASLSLRLFLFVLISINNIYAQNQKDQDVIFEQLELPDGTVQILGTNKKSFPHVVKIDFSSVKNMTFSEPAPVKKVIPGNVEKFILVTLTPEKGKSAGFQYQTIYYPGDNINSSVNREFIYTLPFEKGETFYIGQGYGGSMSHNLKNHTYALDFDLPLGTKVCAARGGKILAVKQDSDKHGKTISSSKYANFIIVAHEDGSYANYFHLKQNSSLVKEGDQIKTGDVIALSGNTGWSDGPHLHFEVYYFNNEGESISIPTKFYIENNKVATLKEEKAYTRR